MTKRDVKWNCEMQKLLAEVGTSPTERVSFHAKCAPRPCTTTASADEHACSMQPRRNASRSPSLSSTSPRWYAACTPHACSIRAHNRTSGHPSRRKRAENSISRVILAREESHGSASSQRRALPRPAPRREPLRGTMMRTARCTLPTAPRTALADPAGSPWCETTKRSAKVSSGRI